MASQQLLERVRELRARNYSPKEIARALGLRPAAVAPLVRAIAAEQGTGERQPGEVGFWVNPGWSRHLTVDGHPDWTDPGGALEGSDGLVTVVAVRERGGTRVSAGVYLVDVYCLGVKDAFTRNVDIRNLPSFMNPLYQQFGVPPLAAPAELARHLVFGGIDYARTLGFGPHPDFAACAAHLGPWTGPSAIRFGHDGKPFFLQGPHDNPVTIMQTLRRSAAQDNFDCLVVDRRFHG